jgi:2,3-bisphosphoglycerate-independent phosphoglycerate mutase
MFPAAAQLHTRVHEPRRVLQSRPLDGSEASKRTATLVNALSLALIEALEAHPANHARLAQAAPGPAHAVPVSLHSNCPPLAIRQSPPDADIGFAI